MDCPVCGTERVSRPGGENLEVVSCPSCQRLSLWTVTMLALAGALKYPAVLAWTLLHAAFASVRSLGARAAGVLSRRPTR